MVLTINYDLKQPGRNYEGLYEVIKKAPAWTHPMESLWFIRTNESVQTWSDRLIAQIDKNDRLFVVDITGKQYSGWMTEDFWEWLRKNNY